MSQDGFTNDKSPVKTYIEDGQILLWEDGTVIGKVDGDKFSWTSKGGYTYIGTISIDLKTIIYHLSVEGGNETDVVLTLIE